MQGRARRVGLTGGIGSGKSTAAALLAARGAAVIDTDAIAREITAPGGAALPALAEAFGQAIFDAPGMLDRAALRRIVFSDPVAKARLEAVLHPMIRKVTAERAGEAQAPAIVFDVPLLVESGRWRRQVDRILVIDCSEATQVERVCRRPGWDADAARRVIAQQATRAERRAIADAVIDNQTITLAQFDAEIGALWQAWVRPD